MCEQVDQAEAPPAATAAAAPEVEEAQDPLIN